MGFVVEPGNVHDSTSFPKLYKLLQEKYKNIQKIVVDDRYKIPAIAKLILEDGKVPVMPYKRLMTKKGFFKKQDYVYDEYYDCYLCPQNQVLKYLTTN